MTGSVWVVLVAVLGLAAVGCGDDEVPTAAGPDADAPSDGAAAELVVVVDGGEFAQLTYTVTCGPGEPSVDPAVDGLDAATACRRLADPEVARLLVDGPDADRICTEIYGGPQVARVTGTLSGRTVDATVSRVNGCEIDAWDRLLAGVLPPTTGVPSDG